MIRPLKKVLGQGRQKILWGLILVGALAMGHFLYAFLSADAGGHPFLYSILVGILVYAVARNLNLWYYYLGISKPDTPTLEKDFSVDILTTFFPGEPHDMVETTLEAIGKITYPHTTYLCDEANDPYLVELCKRLGVIHVTRDNRIDAKAGNINNALKQATGEVCLILDPDHIPEPDFIDHVIPHFQDPEIGFVQVVQSYYNRSQSLVAKGAAQQTFHFYGPVMMGMNGYGTVNAIGANCTFRRAALDQIGGHAAGLAEDMHTAMLLYEKGWRSVYVPKVLAQGLVPSTLTAYYKQQLKWSCGTFDLLWKVYPRIFKSITWRQRLHYALMPLHYLSGVFYFFGFLLPVLSLLWAETPWEGDLGYFLLLAAPAWGSALIIRFYVQQWLISDDEKGFHIIGGLLEIVTWWVFTLGFIYSVIGRKVPYLPTPKDDKDVTHPYLIFPNLLIGLLSLFAVGYGLMRDFTPYSIVMAVFALTNAFFMFFSVYLAVGATNRNRLVRDRLSGGVRWLGHHTLQLLLRSLEVITVFIRRTALILLLAACLCAWWLLDKRQRAEFDTAGFISAEAAFFTADSLITGNNLVRANPAYASYRLPARVPLPTGETFAVDYRKVTSWKDSRYVLSRKRMLTDFKTMKAAGINAIRVTQPGIYEYNLLLLAEESKLGVIYAFPVPKEIDFVTESEILATWKADLLETIERIKTFPKLLSWEIHQNVLTELSKYYEGEDYRAQATAYLEWIEGLLREIKALDKRPVILSVTPNNLMESTRRGFYLELLPVDAFGLMGKTAEDVDALKERLGKAGIPIVNISADPASLVREEEPYVVLANWQNEWRKAALSFNGLLNFAGQKKMAYLKLEIGNGKDVAEEILPKINILPSAVPLYPGISTRYSAMIPAGDQWVIAPDTSTYLFEWRLIKQDQWGHPVALRGLGNGPILDLEIPPAYHRYELMLTVSKDGYARSARSRLNVPLLTQARDSLAGKPVQ